ncbi:MAG: PspA-associated protein PspAA [Actinomycetes bacterium]
MIVRILNEGQYEVAEGAVADLNELDAAVEQAVADGDAERLEQALHHLLEEVREAGTPVPDDELQDSDLILPAADATLDDVQAMLSETDSGLIPG